MGLCFSINREYRKLRKIDGVEKRTFNGITRLAKLTSIYDGDTFKMITRIDHKEPFYEYSIRLTDIDTPEIKPSLSMVNRDLHKQAAVRVRDILRGFYPEGTIFLVDFKKEDKYGRLLGTIWTTKKRFFGLGKPCKDLNLSDWLLKNNLALQYGGDTKSDFTTQDLHGILKRIF